jgi:tetratricopeptide (TPR) repeat protein
MDNHGDTALYLANVTRRDWQAALKEDAGNPSPGARQVEGNTLSDREEVVRVLKQALAQHPLTSFADYVSDLQNHPRDRARRDNVVKLAAALPTPPPIPEQARRLFERASALMKQASEPQELDQSINLLRWALVFAPWWGDAYHNLSRALELTGQYDLAEKNLTYYLELKPPEADARAARAHFSEIQTEKETAASKK